MTVRALRIDNKVDPRTEDQGWAKLSVFLLIHFTQIIQILGSRQLLYWYSFSTFLTDVNIYFG